MTQAEAKSARTPGPAPNIIPHVRRAQAAIERLPQELQGTMRDVMEPLLAFAQEQSTFNRRIKARYLSLPAPHAATHLGGNDNLVSYENPAALEPTSTGNPGTPQGGVAAADHIHDMSAFADLAELEDLLVDDGVPVTDIAVRRLLEAILVELDALETAVLRLERRQTEEVVP